MKEWQQNQDFSCHTEKYRKLLHILKIMIQSTCSSAFPHNGLPLQTAILAVIFVTDLPLSKSKPHHSPPKLTGLSKPQTNSTVYAQKGHRCTYTV